MGILGVGHAGRRAGLLSTSGSFTLSTGAGNAGGNGEEDAQEVEEADTLGESGRSWDHLGGGKCKHGTEAFLRTDPHDKTMGQCVEYEADTKCNLRCYNKGIEVDMHHDDPVCSKICQKPGKAGARCNMIKTVMKNYGSDGKLNDALPYMTRTKVMKAGDTDLSFPNGAKRPLGDSDVESLDSTSYPNTEPTDLSNHPCL